jgi:SAM-dependent methyltransferase
VLPLNKQNAYREKYQRLRPGWHTSGDEFEALARRLVAPETCALDLGCGRGGIMELFWQNVRLAVGVDPDLASLAERRVPMPVICGRGEHLPLPAGTFDLVIGLWVLEHLPRPEAVLREIWRALASGGHFVFLTPNAQHPLIWANRFSWAMPAVQRLLIPRLYGRSEADTFRTFYRANTQAQLRRLAGACGFQIVSQRAIADPTYLAFDEVSFRVSALLERLLPREWGVHLLGDWVKS